MKSKLIFILTFSFLSIGINVLATSPTGLAQLEKGDSSTFDFWIGSWELWWQDTDTTKGYGTNTIAATMDGKVIQENFEAQKGNLQGYIGKSWSVYQPQFGWRQTWVDNQGSYLDFEGGIDGDKKIFQRTQTNPNGKVLLQRMIFHSFTDKGFTWDWESSVDEGKSWKQLWQIHYTRVD